MSEVKLLKEEIEIYEQHIINDTAYDDLFLKNIILTKLRKSKYIIKSLNIGDYTKSPDEPYSYSKYILPYYLFKPVQTDINNYICFETSFTEVPRYNDILKYQQIKFYIVCNCSDGNIIDDEYIVARHDLIAACIIHEFNWCNDLGFQIHLVSDEPVSLDNAFCGRTLVFQQTTPNTILKDGQVINKGK